MNNVALYGSHLQIVHDIEKHNTLKAVQMGIFPTSIIITPDVLKLLHTDIGDRDYIQTIHNNHLDGIFYLLPAGTYGAPEGYHCNGIRYSAYPSDYISLTHIKQFGE